MILFLKKIINNRITKKNRKGGFTLVELLVTMIIFVLLTSVVLFTQGNFDNSILLNNLAYDIALTARQAQNYAYTSKETISGLESSYGIYFDLTKSNKDFVLFSEGSNGNKILDDNDFSCSLGGECIQKYNIKRGSYIKDICVGMGSSCSLSQLNNLSIMFNKGNSEADIYNNNQDYNYAKITLSSAGGATSSVVITKVGQIYVEKK